MQSLESDERILSLTEILRFPVFEVNHRHLSLCSFDQDLYGYNSAWIKLARTEWASSGRVNGYMLTSSRPTIYDLFYRYRFLIFETSKVVEALTDSAGQPNKSNPF